MKSKKVLCILVIIFNIILLTACASQGSKTEATPTVSITPTESIETTPTSVPTQVVTDDSATTKEDATLPSYEAALE